MEKLFLLFFFFHVSSPVRHSLKYLLTATSGVKNVPVEFFAVVMLDEVQVGYCDTNNPAEPKQEWMKKFIRDDPRHLRWYNRECIYNQHLFRATMDSLKQSLNQTEGVHILQRMNGCEWDDETEEVIAFHQYGYDGEDFITLDLKWLTWNATKPQAESIKLEWDADKDNLENNHIFYLHECPDWLKKYVQYRRSFLQGTAPPKVFLLQQTPSSPVRCFASGFYPERAALFWRKDGDDLHEDVEHGEVLPNTDGTFQMSVDLNISSVTPEDWRRYECVFQLFGVKDKVTKLDKAVIKTNYETPSNMAAIMIAAVVVVALVLIAAMIGAYLYKKKKNAKYPQTSETSSEVNVALKHL